MGRARDLADTAAGGALAARVTAVEANDVVVAGQISALTTSVDTANANASAAVAGLALKAKLPLYHRLGPGQENPNGPSIQITTAAFTAWKDIWKMAVPFALNIGDILTVASEMEIRNDATYLTEIVTSMILTANGALNEGQDIDGTGIYIGPGNGHNVTPVPGGAHYTNVPRVSVYKMLAAYATPYIYVRARCRSGEATGGEFCTSMAGYGHLSLTVTPA